MSGRSVRSNRAIIPHGPSSSRRGTAAPEPGLPGYNPPGERSPEPVVSESAEADQAAAERRQQAIGVESGAARAAVLGINDGLVTNTALILGVVGATDVIGVVQLTGLASLVAGACSMAAGEYVSMRAQVELLERLLEDERRAMIAAPERERAVIRGALEKHGFDPVITEQATRGLANNIDRALDVYSRVVLGVNPDELGSPRAAALTSAIAFATGALIPLVPWY